MSKTVSTATHDVARPCQPVREPVLLVQWRAGGNSKNRPITNRTFDWLTMRRLIKLLPRKDRSVGSQRRLGLHCRFGRWDAALVGISSTVRASEGFTSRPPPPPPHVRPSVRPVRQSHHACLFFFVVVVRFAWPLFSPCACRRDTAAATTRGFSSSAAVKDGCRPCPP